MSATQPRRIVELALSLLLISCSNFVHADTTPINEIKSQQLYKLDDTGSRLHKQAAEWSCVEDATTGLFWQKLDPSKALHDHASYTWYQPQQSNSGAELAYPVGSPLNVTCHNYRTNEPSSYCNTDAYIQRVNQASYCGYSDWRLPTTEELTSLATPSNNPHLPNINLEYFPFYDRFVYWTDTVNEDGIVLTVAQETKVTANAESSDQLLIRLVRGTQY